MKTNLSKKIVIIIALISLICQGVILKNTSDAIRIAESELTEEEEKLTGYEQKANECRGSVMTTLDLVNNSGLSSCGKAIAINYNLTVASLSNIYYNYCSEGAGVAVYGCVSMGKIYVCAPGTSVYDVLSSYNTRYFRWWTYLSYACSESEAKNTIRHEVLHVVYNRLSSSEQSSIIAKLEPYRASYSSELAAYSVSQQDDELFARVGADGRVIDDIKLIDVYSQGVATYLSQKADYYSKLIDSTSEQIASYESLLRNYNALRGALVAVVVITVASLIAVFLIVRARKKRGHKDGKEKSRHHQARDFNAWASEHGVTENGTKVSSLAKNRPIKTSDVVEDFQRWAIRHGVSSDDSSKK